VLSAAITMLLIYQDAPPAQSTDTNEPDEMAELLSTTTVQINYTVSISAGDATNTYNFTETGTLAHHLKRATLLNASIRTNPDRQQLSYAIPCVELAREYQGRPKEQYRGAEQSDPWYSNGHRYPPSYYNNSEGRIKDGYREYVYTGLKDGFWNKSGTVDVLKDTYVNSSGNLSSQYMNDDGKPKQQYLKDVRRQDVEDVRCNPTGKLSPQVRSNYNAIDTSQLSSGDRYRQLVETNYDEKIGQKITESLRLGTDNYRIEANWQPYSRPDGTRPYISGSVGIGNKPSKNQDVSSATLAIPSGMATAQEVRGREYGGGISESIGAAIVEGYFPQAESRYELGRGETSQAYRKDLYLRVAGIIGGGGSPKAAGLIGNEITSKYSPDTGGLNTALTDMFKQKIFLQDLNLTPESAIRESISTGKVDIVVTTW